MKMHRPLAMGFFLRVYHTVYGRVCNIFYCVNEYKRQTS